jgi:phosphotransferase system  glucose/maltose/N-acetylglucosamine-specific IIC component
MQRQILNFVIETAALAVMVAMLATGFLLKCVLPPGSRGGQDLQLWEMTRHAWGDVHFGLAVALLLPVLIHVVLHWAWVCALIARLAGATSPRGAAVAHWRQWRYGIGLLVVCCLLATGFLWLAHAQTKRGGGEERGRGGVITQATA